MNGKWLRSHGACCYLHAVAHVPDSDRHPADWDVNGSELEPPTLDDLHRARKAYPEAAGLGWDNFHPKWILQLPEEYQTRFLWLLHVFERRPRVLRNFITYMMFLESRTAG